DTDGTGTGGLTPPTSAEVRAAERQVAQQRANKDRAIAAAKAEIANANANLTNARNDYDNALDALGESIVAAPADGIVTAVNIAKGDTVSGGSSGAGGNSATGNPGGGSGTAAVEISSYSDAMLVAIDVTEAEVDSVKVGMDAEVTFDAFPELTAEGKVTAVAPTGTASGGLVMFSVTVELADPDARLRPGMNATGKIILDTAKNVLLVPNTALQGDQRGGYFVRVVARSGNAAQPEPQKVALGLANDSYSEVVSGLREGDVVVTGRVSDSLSGGGGIMGNRMMDGGSGPTIRRRSDPEPSNSGRGATGQEPPRGDK
ncbi:MAG: efflux RND transporter periplasmic adaptor subunit, partial [Coriobacteriia bacterium]|nr:efflux RND transporter periplasmic adaptor subunit [Coriobacteriia bacterium]